MPLEEVLDGNLAEEADALAVFTFRIRQLGVRGEFADFRLQEFADRKNRLRELILSE